MAARKARFVSGDTGRQVPEEIPPAVLDTGQAVPTGPSTSVLMSLRPPGSIV